VPNDWWVTEEIREQIKTSWTPMQMKKICTRICGTQKSHAKGKVYSYKFYINKNRLLL
jgi:hypothetical protein